MNDEDELLDLVNRHDEVIGTILRSEYNTLAENNLGYIRSVEMLIQNDEGKLWIPRRTADKKIAPDGLDYSMGGHVGSGEGYVESALREIKEELNLDLLPEDLQFIKKFEPAVIPYFRAFYIYHSNETPDYNPKDFVGADWLGPDEIIKKINNGSSAKTTLLETVLVLKEIHF